MQTVWKGSIAFGLVSIPVRLHTATQEHDVPLHQVHAKDGSRVRYRRFCEAEGKEIPYAEIARGYELPDGDTVVLTGEDLDSLPLSTSKSVEVLQFVPMDQIDPINMNRTYFVRADPQGIKPYVLLRDALVEADTVAVVKVSLRSREALAVIRPYGEVLLLQTMLWPDEVRDAGQVAPDGDVTIKPQEKAMAASYIETLTGDFDPNEYSDDYTEALRSLVEAKAAGRPPRTEEPEAPEPGEVIDLASALERSVAEARARREAKASGGSSGSSGGSKSSKSEGSKSTAKSSTAKSSTSKSGGSSAKSAGSKSAGSKSADSKSADSKTDSKAESKSSAKSGTRQRKGALSGSKDKTG